MREFQLLLQELRYYNCLVLMIFFSRTPAYLCIAEHFEHICVERFNGLIVASQDLLLNGAQVQRVRHLLIVLAVPGNRKKATGSAWDQTKHLYIIRVS